MFVCSKCLLKPTAHFLISWSFGENRLGGEKPDSDSFSCHLPRTKEKAEFVSGWAPLRGLNQGLGSSRQDRPVQLPRDPDARSRSGFRSEYPAGHRGAGESPQHQTQVFTTSQPVGRLFEGGVGKKGEEGATHPVDPFSPGPLHHDPHRNTQLPWPCRTGTFYRTS